MWPESWGSMAIEYDFDPEDDLIQEGDRSLDFRYQTKAVVASCINTGEITGKQNYTGGIVWSDGSGTSGELRKLRRGLQ